jgi:hypothetical protein
MKRTILAALVALVLSFTFSHVAQAHEGHTHKVMGTVSAINGQHIDVKTSDGKTVTVMTDAKTTVTRGKEKLTASAVKVGDRISVDAMQEKDMMMAQAIKLAAATPTTAAATKPATATTPKKK